MKNIFYFGEKHKDYHVRVLNERELRAAAGIFFAFAFFSFLLVLLKDNLYFLKLFVSIFTIDFIIRVLINPKYAPSLIFGRIFVKKQTPEYSGAKQKRFAWTIGLILSLIMFYSLVLKDEFGILNLIICILCLVFLFAESTLGICMACNLHSLITGEKSKLCPGGVCEIQRKDEIQKISFVQILILIIFFSLIFFGLNLI